MKDELIYINNELQQIYVRGIDTVHMANALNVISQLIKSAEEESVKSEEESEEERKE